MSNLYLIGTIHTDLDGKERLEHVLNKISPSTIALEFHKQMEKYHIDKSREAHDKEVGKLYDESSLNLTPKQRKLALDISYETIIAQDFEFSVSKNYINSHPKSKLHYIDIEMFNTSKKEKSFQEMLKNDLKRALEDPECRESIMFSLKKGKKFSLDNIRKDTALTYDSVDEYYKFFKRMRNPKELKKLEKELSLSEIEALKVIYSEERDNILASKIQEVYDGKTLVAIMGFGHLKAIGIKLKDLKPQIMTLAEYNKL